MGLSQKNHIPLDEAEDVMNKILGAYPKLDETIQQTQEFVKRNHYVETIAGFRRRLGDVLSKDKGKVSRTLRQAFNARVQGSGAYFTNNALIMMSKLFQAAHMKSKIIMTVHDSIVVDCSPDEILPVVQFMTYSFEQLPLPVLVNNEIGTLKVPKDLVLPDGIHYRFPLTCEINIGRSYGEALDYVPEDIPRFKSLELYCQYYHTMELLKDYQGAKLLSDEEAESKIKSLEDQKAAFLK